MAFDNFTYPLSELFQYKWGRRLILISLWSLIPFKSGWTLPAIGGLVCIILFAIAMVTLHRFDDYWAALPPSEGIRLSTICDNIKVISLYGLFIFTVMGIVQQF
ncbi:MAG: hypothetical protein ACI97A_003791 [Planctomycetota bacterium]|jgi:hypothetical protein